MLAFFRRGLIFALVVGGGGSNSWFICELIYFQKKRMRVELFYKGFYRDFVLGLEFLKFGGISLEKNKAKYFLI